MNEKPTFDPTECIDYKRHVLDSRIGFIEFDYLTNTVPIILRITLNVCTPKKTRTKNKRNEISFKRQEEEFRL
jgi:hypothetical protein